MYLVNFSRIFGVCYNLFNSYLKMYLRVIMRRVKWFVFELWNFKYCIYLFKRYNFKVIVGGFL